MPSPVCPQLALSPRCAGSFRENGHALPADVDDAEAPLAYVAVTRALWNVAPAIRSWVPRSRA